MFYLSISDMLEYCQFETFNATCPSDQVIIMTSAKYGRMNLGRCVKHNYGYTGCNHDVTSEVDKRCSGRQWCSIAVPDESLHSLAPCPSGLSAYFSASYTCLDGKYMCTYGLMVRS